MDSKNKEGHRLNISKETETIPKSKGKEKARKELWDSLCAVYENENGDEEKAKQQIKGRDELVPDYCDGLPRHTKYDLKLSKIAKSRHLKNISLNENDSIKCNAANGEDKRRHKLKELEKHKKLNAAVPEDFLKEKDKNAPSVIVLHKYKRGIFNTQAEPQGGEVNSSDKATHRQEKNGEKTSNERKLSPQKHFLSNKKSSCHVLKKQSSKIDVDSKNSLDYNQKLKDKNRKKRDKAVVYKALSTSLESKLRKKRKKLERQQILKEVASSLNEDIDIYDKIKSLPIKIDENQLIFMHPSHIKKALENYKIKKNNCREKVNNDSTCNELNESKSNKAEEKPEASLTKLPLGNNASSKKLRVLSSIKKIRKSIPIVLEEKSDISFIKVSKHKKDLKKRKSKLTPSEKNKSIQEEPDPEEDSKGSGKVKIGKNLMSSENYSKAQCSVIRQNVCFGDNSDDISNVQNDKVPTTLSSILRSKSKVNKVCSNLKNNSTKELKIRRINQNEMEKLKTIIKKNDETENQQKPSVSEDENKLTFQLLKTNTNSKNLGRLRKNVYSISDRKGSKDNIIPAKHNDRLYVTKRMLFYTNKESSSTSKESLNIAIRRDTEISNNGSSNNVLNVVIKQKKNSSTSTKSINSPKLGIENQCSKHCGTKSLEKMFVENYLEKIYNNNNNDKQKTKHLKEAECQTEENEFNSDNKEGTKSKEGRNQVSTQSSEPSSNTIQDEFRNFLTYHFKNMNPAIWRNNALGKNTFNDDGMLNKIQTFQPGTDRIQVQCKFEDHYPNFLKVNEKYLVTENQYSNTKLSGIVHNFESTTCPNNDCSSEMKPFIRVLDNVEDDLQKSKCVYDSGVSKVSASDESKYEQNESDEKKGITKLSVEIAENQCQKTESENIAEKLKNIGLSDKTSFVKVIKSNNKLETSINTKVDNQDTLKFKPSPQMKKDFLAKPVKETMKEDFKKVITRRQRSKFVLPKHIISLTEGAENGNMSKSLCAQTIKNSGSTSIKDNCFSGKNKKLTTDTYNLNTNKFWSLEKTNNNDLQITEEDNLKPVKENFVNVLSLNEDKGETDDLTAKTREIAKNLFEVTKKTSYGVLRNFIVPEVGVKTKTCALPSVPYKNVSCLNKVEKSNFAKKNEQNMKEADFAKKKPCLSNRNEISKLIHIDNIILPQEKGSFVHVINKKYDNNIYPKQSKILLEKNTQVSHPQNFYENKNEKQISIQKGFDEEKQIVYKINAVYEFLQYLDKMLKDNSFLKLGENLKNTSTLGHFNSTLRCLCNNCIEIINKIEVNGVKNLQDRKALENLISQPLKETVFLGQTIGEANYERSLNVDSLSNGQYVALNELNNNSTTTNDLRSNIGQMNPFCVIVTPEKKSCQLNNNDFCTKIESNQSKKVSESVSSFNFKEKSYEDFMKQKFSEMANKTSTNKVTKCSKIPKSKINFNKTATDSNAKFYKQINQRHTHSNDYSSNCLPLKPSLMKSCEPQSKFNCVGDNNNSRYQPHDTAKPQFNYIRSDNSKLKLDSQCSKNVCDSTGHYFSKQQDLSRDSHSDLCKSSKTVSNPLKNVRSKNKLGSSCSKNAICQCFLSKNVSSGNKTENLPNENYNHLKSCKIQTKPSVSDVGLCKGCRHKKCECCPSSTKLSYKKVWLPKIKSSFRMSFKKDGKTAIKDLPHCLGLPSGNIDETTPSENINVDETIIQGKNYFETQHKSITLTKTQLNVKDKTNSLGCTQMSEDSNGCRKCKRDSAINRNEQSCEREAIDKKALKYSKQRHVEHSKGFGGQMPLSTIHSPRGSIIIIKRNLQKDNHTSTSNSVEYLCSSPKCNNENESNEEDKELDSDGWVPLNDITEIENNQIYLGMDIKNMTVRHVDYLQKFPENLLNCKSISENKET